MSALVDKIRLLCGKIAQNAFLVLVKNRHLTVSTVLINVKPTTE
ncbi:hypothetical protein GPLA_0871 [Paraglaciecola polaris LMG 21857]|uniref:Uncharacterized protein n=1 Tax=Paraglaciecola polaris LMG 21857 TaxID=1129793 RepID=K6ZNC6_9ALTE|nr:hypothetical protein GPLA_0871 [Paraglaciecola polaris LMG 21857]